MDKNPREGWDEAFKRMHENGDDELLIPDNMEQLTKREYIAAIVLQGLVAKAYEYDDSSFTRIRSMSNILAKDAIILADSLIENLDLDRNYFNRVTGKPQFPM